MCQNSFELFDRTVYQVCGAWQWDNVRQWSRPVFCGRSGADTVHPLLSFTYHYGLSKDFIWSTHLSPHIWPEPGNTWTMTVSGSGERHLKMSDFVKLCLEIICHRLIVIMYDITDHSDSSWASLSWQYWVSWQDTNIVNISGDSGDQWPRCAQCWPM